MRQFFFKSYLILRVFRNPRVFCTGGARENGTKMFSTNRKLCMAARPFRWITLIQVLNNLVQNRLFIPKWYKNRKSNINDFQIKYKIIQMIIFFKLRFRTAFERIDFKS